jgi:hypothetical protein
MARNEDKEYELRKSLTFEQAEGVEPLPCQLKPRELSQALRAALWNVIYRTLEGGSYVESGGYSSGRYFVEPWENILYGMHVTKNQGMADEYDNTFNFQVPRIKSIFQKGDYVAVYGWLQWVLRRHDVPSELPRVIGWVLENHGAGYRLINENTLVPVSSDAELATLERAFADVAAAEFHGARAHLQNAAAELSAGHHADSVRESIHAVESVVRVLEPTGDFSKALAKLESKFRIHGALKSGFASLYGFTSDEKGIRHALLEAGSPAVDETDALFMIGACAAFVSYLINKAGSAGLLNAKAR